MKTALTIAGSDSSGGAGIQADLKAMTLNGVFAMSAVTALTAQNTTGVTDILEATPAFLEAELDAVFTDIFPDAVKIGMVSSEELITVIARKLRQYGARHIVVDPVMVATSGAKLLRDEARTVLMEELLPLAEVVTPNIPEAELLSGVAITDEASLRAAADALLATGLHRVFISLGGDGVFAADRSGERVHLPVLPAEMVNTTGCGDAFMAAITWAYLAGTDLTGTAKAGLAASAIAMEGAETINPAMSAEALKLRAGL